MEFVRHAGGDYVRVAHILLVQPNPEDIAVADAVPINATLVGGFGVVVNCGELRRALASLRPPEPPPVGDTAASQYVPVPERGRRGSAK